MTNNQKISLARDFFRHVSLFLEDIVDDEIYAEIDPDNDFGDELPLEFNHETIKEVLKLGFVAKYGTCLKI